MFVIVPHYTGKRKHKRSLLFVAAVQHIRSAKREMKVEMNRDHFFLL